MINHKITKQEVTKQDIYSIFNTLHSNNPHPTTELIYNSTFELLISVILSAQATDISVNKATKQLFLIANTPEQILALGEETLKTYIKTIGLFNSKTKNILTTCAMLINKFSSIVPNTREELEQLSGVGRKTANVVLNTAFGQPTIAVDTHVFRVSKRIGLSNGKTPLQVELDLNDSIPLDFLPNAHHLLILHGRYICTAKKPQCKQCIINTWCQYYKIHTKISLYGQE